MARIKNLARLLVFGSLVSACSSGGGSSSDQDDPSDDGGSGGAATGGTATDGGSGGTSGSGGEPGGTGGTEAGGAAGAPEGGTGTGDAGVLSTDAGDGDGGAECPSGEQDNDGDGVCAPDCLDALGSPTIQCVHGACDSATGEAICECLEGYTGTTCTECASGYQDDDGNGVCKLGCDATGSDALDCGTNGSCAIDSNGVRGCECVPGYAGDLCDALFVPSETQLTLWLDASVVGTLSKSGSQVVTWSDRRTSGSFGSVTQGTSGLRPTFDDTGMNGMRTVVFDGVDDQLETTGNFASLAVEDYTVVVVAEAFSSVNFPQFIIHGRYESQTARGVGFGRLDATNFRLRHSADANIASDLLDLSGFADETEPKVFAARRNGTGTTPELYFAASDGSTIAAQSTTATPGQPSLSVVSGGGNLVLSLGDGSFEGQIAEVLIYVRALDDVELTHLQTSLAMKWGL